MRRGSTLFHHVLPPIALGIATLVAPSAHAQSILQQYSASRCGGAQSTWLQHNADLGDLFVINLIRLQGTQIIWNDTPVTEGQTLGYIQDVAAISPSPLTALSIRGDTDCALVQRIRAALEQAVDCPMKCFEYSEAEWGQRFSPPPPPPPRHRRKSRAR